MWFIIFYNLSEIFIAVCIFFVIGLLIEYIFKKYLSNLFSTELSGNMENKPQDDKKSDKDFKENLDFQNKNSLYENSQNISSSGDFIEEVKKYKFETEDVSRGSDKNKKCHLLKIMIQKLLQMLLKL